MNRVLQRVKNASHVAVVAHINPDADSLGAASAIYTYLLQQHKKVSFYCASKHISNRFTCIPWIEKVSDTLPRSVDLAIALDCASKERLGVELECEIINIDHHASNTLFGDINFIDRDAISTTKLLYDLFKKEQVKINPKMATALYAGLVDDSDGFVSEDIDGTTFALVSELIALGADFKRCNRYLRRYESLAALRIKGWILQNMELLCNAKVALVLISHDTIKRFGAENSDITYALEEALYLPTVELAFLFLENKNGSIKCSIRSQGVVDISKIAKHYGGGGHKSRAGFILEGDISLARAKEEIVDTIRKELALETK